MQCEVAGADSVSCEPGVFDCCSLDVSTTASLLQCAPYASPAQPPDQLKWLAGLAMATMALMSFGIGANDAANSWGTSVGSGAISLRWAVILGGLMDWLGASALGAGVHAVRLTNPRPHAVLEALEASRRCALRSLVMHATQGTTEPSSYSLHGRVCCRRRPCHAKLARAHSDRPVQASPTPSEKGLRTRRRPSAGRAATATPACRSSCSA